MRQKRRGLLAAGAATPAAPVAAGCVDDGPDGETPGADEDRPGTSTGGEGAVRSGQSYVHTFEATGTHEYYCIPHEAAGMTGPVAVE